MNIDDLFRYIFPLFVLVIGGTFLFNYIKHGSFKGAAFGATIQRTVGEVTTARGSMTTTVLRIHVLGANTPTGPTIGIEHVTKSFASYQMSTIALNDQQARALIVLLEGALTPRR